MCHHHQLLEPSEEQPSGGLDNGIPPPIPSIHGQNCNWKESLMANQNGNNHQTPSTWHCDDLWKNPSDSLLPDRTTHSTLPGTLESDFDVDNVSQNLTAPDVCVHREAPPQRRVLQQPPVSRVRLRFALNKERKVALKPYLSLDYTLRLDFFIDILHGVSYGC